MRKLIARPFFALHDWLVNKEPLQRLGCYIAFGYKKMKKDWGENYRSTENDAWYWAGFAFKQVATWIDGEQDEETN